MEGNAMSMVKQEGAYHFRLYNTLTRKVEEIQPMEPGHLRFYSCGPTVYSYAHIGNFRTFLTADLIVRTAQAIGWKVTYVTNITDVGHLTEDDLADAGGEDKMVQALRREGRRFANIWDLAEYYALTFKNEWMELNLVEPYVRPKATQHIREQIRFIEQLIEKGHAYETRMGVYFHVPSFPEYGKLSGNRDLQQLIQAARDVIVDPEKRDPRDFALWKKDPRHLMQWYSPWGWGFPGWHIECSAMSMRYLGDSFDLHGGGEDLIFPHHECEIAQSESLTNKPFARYWVHTRFLQVEGEKMSKSKGNFYTVRELILPPHRGGKGIDPLVLRYALIAGQYRKPLNFTWEGLAAAARTLARYREVEERIQEALQTGMEGPDTLGERLEAIYTRTLEAMLDDLNTPVALAEAYEGTRVVLKEEALSAASARSARKWLDRTNALLGFIRHEVPREVVEEQCPLNLIQLEDAFEQMVEQLIAERAEARKRRDFARADAIREQLLQMGIEVMDTPQGTKWRRKVVID